MQEQRGTACDDASKPVLKTIFDDYEPPEGIVLHDPSPPSALRMVFSTASETNFPHTKTFLGQIIDGGHTIRVIRRMGDAGVTVRHLSAAMRLLGVE